MNNLRVRKIFHQFLYRGIKHYQSKTTVLEYSKITLICRRWSSSSSSKKILSVSSLLQQDGSDIQELPVIVRHSDKTMFPFNDLINGVSRESSEDAKFKSMLQTCVSVKDVYKFLDIPADKVNVYSATYALVKICQLMQRSEGLDDLHSFIHTAIINELCDTVNNDISTLTNEKLIMLTICYAKSQNLIEKSSESITQEIEKRLGDEQFSISELCSLSKILETSKKENSKLYNHLWIHIGNRYQDINESNIVEVFNLLPVNRGYIEKLLSKQLNRCLWKLQIPDITSILSSLHRLNNKYHPNFFKLAKQLSSHNIYDISSADLMILVNAYIRLKYPVPVFYNIMENYVTLKKDDLDIDLMVLIVEHCRSKLYLSPIILDIAADNFTKHGDNYNTLQIFSILRSFGQLNYLPKEPMNFLFKVESVLHRMFNDFEVDELLEILCSFAMVEKISINSVQSLVSKHFYTKISELPATRRRFAVQWLQLLYKSAKVEGNFKHSILSYPYKYESTQYMYKDNYSRRISNSLIKIFGIDSISFSRLEINTFHIIDYEVLLDENGKSLPVSEFRNAFIKLAIIHLKSRDTCVNCPQLVGKAAMKVRQLKKVGYHVIQIPENLSNVQSKVIEKHILAKLLDIM